MTARPPLPILLTVFIAMLAPRAARADPLLPADAKVERVAGGFTHAEGPLWHPDGYLLFGDTPRDRIVKCDEAGNVSIFREPCGRTTALGLDPQGRLVANESHGGDEGARRVSRHEGNGTWVTLANRFVGKRLTSPNDLAIDARDELHVRWRATGHALHHERRDAVSRAHRGPRPPNTAGQIGVS